MTITLDPRLEAIASLVRKDSIVADIGTDHGYLIVSLLERGTAISGFATDINEKPLTSARELIKSKGLEHKIETVLCDGIAPLAGKGITDIVIAGMGGELIAAMLQDASWVRECSLSLVLQPMTRPETLRVYLFRAGFSIAEEIAVVSGKHVYSVIRAVYTGVSSSYTLKQEWLGGLADKRDSDSLAYFRRVIKRLGHLVRSETDPERKAEMNALRKELERTVLHESK